MRTPLLTLSLLLAAMATNAAEPARPGRVLAFMKTQGLYNLCTSRSSAELGQCEGFITGVAAMMQNDQLAKVKVCVPEGTNSQQVTDRVVAYLRTKADSDDMQVPAVTIVAPVLAILYNCTPGKMPQF
ncbi:Rap1a/Tai family immunity protein [Chitiniphilus shinanonensis]|uniref:Rap1a/Tai family immunity protein n=1 Tax=Chitiniphilus shinanonensis TaxID=553088 RepID=UPI003341FE23